MAEQRVAKSLVMTILLMVGGFCMADTPTQAQYEIALRIAKEERAAAERLRVDLDVARLRLKEQKERIESLMGDTAENFAGLKRAAYTMLKWGVPPDTVAYILKLKNDNGYVTRLSQYPVDQLFPEYVVPNFVCKAP